MKKIGIIIVLLMVFSCVSVMGACQKWETSTVSPTEGPQNLERTETYDEFSFGFAEIVVIDGVYDVDGNYDHCMPSDYLNEYSCDGNEARMQLIECELGCETVDYSFGQFTTPFGRCKGGSDSAIDRPDRVITDLETCDSKAEIDAERTLVKSEVYFYKTEKRRVSMETGIDYYGLNGIDVTDLESFRDALVASQESAGSAAEINDKEAFETAVEAGNAAIDSFRDAVHVLNNENGFVIDEIKAEIAADLEENEDYFKGLEVAMETSGREHDMHKYDVKVCVAENGITPLEMRGADITEAKSHLDAILDSRADFESLLMNAQDVCVVSVYICESDLAVDFRVKLSEVNEKFIALSQELKEIRGGLNE